MEKTTRTTRSRGRPSRSALGISLPEILVVVALIGILALIGGMPFLATLKRQRLGAASANLQGFCQRALTEMQRQELRAQVPALAQAARTIGSPHIRAAATLGGNLIVGPASATLTCRATT